MENRDSRMWFYLTGGFMFTIVTVNILLFDVFASSAARGFK